MSIIDAVVGSSRMAASSPVGLGAADQKSDFAKILADFRKAASETPFDRIRDAVLKKHGMTQDQYDQLSGPAKDAIAREIREAIQRAVAQGQKGQGAGPSNVGPAGTFA
jgi:hypothetical protein